MRSIFLSILLAFAVFITEAQDGHELWLRSDKKPVPVKDHLLKNTPALTIAKQELQQGWQGQPDAAVTLTITKNSKLKNDGFRLTPNGVEANTDLGILYGVYELLRRQQTGESVLDEICNPSYDIRILNHWDNLNGTVERGYAGMSIFWRKDDPFVVTEKDKTRWQEYARANASVGINGSSINNVNASPTSVNT